MFACLDVDYRGDSAVAACVLFEHWDDGVPCAEFQTAIHDVRPYTPGAFYLRELPCLLAVLARVPLQPTQILIDGYVWLAKERPGLGVKLYEALQLRTPVMGVAKTSFHANDAAMAVTRGHSAKPLYVTAIGMDLSQASASLAHLHGPNRIPTMLARADELCRATTI